MKSIVIGTAGHIDHGKSALVRALTGTDPDRLKEEKARGITIDLGFAHLESGGVNLAFVDVPGHERFVKNMLAGAGGIDAVMLVVAADESVMPQTREHFHICRLLQVPAGVIVLTKSDLADEDMLEIARLETRELVAGSFLADAPILTVSARTGAGLDLLRVALTAMARQVPGRDRAGAARLPIDRVFSVKGFGTVVTGTLVSGTIRVEQDLQVLPGDRAVKVRGLQVHGRRESQASAGHRVAANLGGADVADLQRGDTLCERGTLEPTRRFDGVIAILDGARALKHGTRVRFHHGTSELLGRVAVGAAVPGDRPRPYEPGVDTDRSRDEDDGGAALAAAPDRGIPPDGVGAGGRAFVRLRLEAPAVVTRGDRFILRAYSPPVTIGGGTVLDPHPPRGAIRTAAGRARFGRLHTSSADEAALAFVQERGAFGLEVRSLVSRAGLSGAQADAIVERLTKEGRVVEIGGLLVAPAVLADLARRLLAAIDAHHAAEPLSDGLPREEGRERVFRRAATSVFDAVVARLVADGKIVARDRLALAGRQLSLSPEEARAQASLERVFRDAGLAPPDLAAAAAAAGVPPAVADRVSKLLLRRKTLVKIDVLLFHADALAGLRAEVRGLKGAGEARVDVAAFKQRYGITRKYAIPLLEYLDRERVTRRVGDSRVVL